MSHQTYQLLSSFSLIEQFLPVEQSLLIEQSLSEKQSVSVKQSLFTDFITSENLFLSLICMSRLLSQATISVCKSNAVIISSICYSSAKEIRSVAI